MAEACARCFPAGTPVATPSGERPIDTLRVGDRVLSEDPTTGTVEAEPVQAVIHDPVSPLIALALSDGSSVAVTADHRFWVDGGARLDHAGWLPAGQLLPGDHLRTAKGEDVVVLRVRYHAGGRRSTRSNAASRRGYIDLFLQVASNPANLRANPVATGLLPQGAVPAGVQAYTRVIQPTGEQVWLFVRNGVIQDAGINPIGAFR